jgi:hypothetical protein
MAEKDKAREERLAAALRENLRRRKAQARARNEKAPEKPATEAAKGPKR